VTEPIPVLRELAEIPADWTYVYRQIDPGKDLAIPGAYLKWYDIRIPEDPAFPEVSEEAREYLRTEAAAGNIAFKQDLGYAMLELEESGYYLIVCVWRTEELYTGIFVRDTNGFTRYPLKPETPDTLHATQSVAELDCTAHERRAWSRYLRSARDEAAKRTYIEDYCTGVVGAP
jgi:hypothetical protein